MEIRKYGISLFLSFLVLALVLVTIFPNTAFADYSFPNAAVQISNTGPDDYFQPDIITSGNDVYLTWFDASLSDTMFAFSTDGGNTFSAPQDISNDASVLDNPQLAVVGSNIYIVWTDNSNGNNQIFFSTSVNGGSTFSTPAPLSGNTGSAGGPQIAATGSNVYQLSTGQNIPIGEWFTLPSGMSIPVGEMYDPIGPNAYYNYFTFFEGNKTISDSRVISSLINDSYVYPPENPRPSILFYHDKLHGSSYGLIWVKLWFNPQPTPTRKIFAYATLSSNADPNGLPVILEESQPQSKLLTSVSYIQFSSQQNTSYSFTS